METFFFAKSSPQYQKWSILLNHPHNARHRFAPLRECQFPPTST